jgi:hypothetical protein
MLRTARTVLQLLALVASVTLAAGCGGDNNVTGTGNPTGTYTLRSIEGDPVPAMLVQLPDYTFEITAGNLTLNADGSYTGSITWRENDDGAVDSDTDEDAGTWTRSNSAFSFVSSVQDLAFTGSLSGSTMTVIDEDGLTLVFRK